MTKNIDFSLVRSFKELLCLVLGNTAVVVMMMRVLQGM